MKILDENKNEISEKQAIESLRIDPIENLFFFTSPAEGIHVVAHMRSSENLLSTTSMNLQTRCHKTAMRYIQSLLP